MSLEQMRFPLIATKNEVPLNHKIYNFFIYRIIDNMKDVCIFLYRNIISRCPNTTNTHNSLKCYTDNY